MGTDIMTKDKSLYNYFNEFMTAYPSTSVPDDVVLPYMTYDVVLGKFGDPDAMVEVNMWWRTESEATPNSESERFRRYIEDNNLIACDEGYIWVKPASPWCQALNDETDNAIKRRYINLALEYLTK